MSDTNPIPPASERELLPCPFCGHDSPEFERMGTSSQSCIVICGNCGARHESGDEYLRSGLSWNTRAALSHPSPQGWKLVPVEPTEEMLAAGEIPTIEMPLRGGGTYQMLGLGAGPSSIYRKMLAAAPLPVQERGEA